MKQSPQASSLSVFQTCTSRCIVNTYGCPLVSISSLGHHQGQGACAVNRYICRRSGSSQRADQMCLRGIESPKYCSHIDLERQAEVHCVGHQASTVCAEMFPDCAATKASVAVRSRSPLREAPDIRSLCRDLFLHAEVHCVRHHASTVCAETCFPIVPTSRPVWPSVAEVHCARHQTSKVFAETCFSIAPTPRPAWLPGTGCIQNMEAQHHGLQRLRGLVVVRGGDKVLRHKGAYLHGISARKGERQDKGSKARAQRSKGGSTVQCTVRSETRKGRRQCKAARGQECFVFFFGGGFSGKQRVLHT